MHGDTYIKIMFYEILELKYAYEAVLDGLSYVYLCIKTYNNKTKGPQTKSFKLLCLLQVAFTL